MMESTGQDTTGGTASTAGGASPPEAAPPEATAAESAASPIGTSEMARYAKHYDEGSFWSKIGETARRAGRSIVERALELYYTLREGGLPRWAKILIVGALGYFILPVDAIPDLLPLVGLTDDLGVLTLALSAVAAFASPAARVKAVAAAARYLRSR